MIGRTTENRDDRMIAEVDEDVHLCPYDPEWPLIFAYETERITPVFPLDAAVEHIGSTSVQGLLAKPIIDIMVGVQGSDALDGLGARLRSAGYDDLGEAGVPGRLYFRRRAEHCFNVHVTVRDGPIWKANLALRDYLRCDPDARIEYTEAKREALESGCKTLLRYSDHKRATVERLISRALDRKQ
jgi:GrpB-like predicted nucleotidyltransferase (UPF0157 family)